jgi:uncharacterized RDD family membrane protein YckC
MDDYYALLGVDTDAATDEIRTAYREKKAALGSDTESARADVALLNRAWNVLSDPYQRGRYDEQRARAEAEGELGEAPELESVPASPRGRRPATARDNRRQLAPTIDLPSGVQWAPNRRRLVAMAIDLTVLMLLYVVAQYVVFPNIAKATHQETIDRIEQLTDEYDAARDETDELDQAADEAENRAEESGTAADEETAREAREAADDAQQREDDLSDDIRTENAKLFPTFLAVTGGAFLIGLLYLVIPSGRTGATFGKRLQRLKVLRQDGAPIAWSDAFRRYGIVLGVTFGLTLIPGLGPLGAALVILGVTRWMSNPNHQGLHDRLAKTIVVTADDGPS